MDDIQLLAEILQGEAAVLGPAGMTAVAAVFVARLLSPAYPNTVADVAPPFYGRAIPGDQALFIAAYALTNTNKLLAEHGTYFFAFSAQDRRQLNLPPGDRQLIRSRTWQLHLYKEDPLDPHHPLSGAPITQPLPSRHRQSRQDARIQ